MRRQGHWARPAGRCDIARRARSRALRHGAGPQTGALVDARANAWGARRGRAVGLQAVHLVHSACF